MKKNTNKHIGLHTLPLSKASVVPLSNLVEILYNISARFTLVTGNEGYVRYRKDGRFQVYDVNYKIDDSKWKIGRFLYGQLKASIIQLKLSREVHYWFFFGGQRSIIPIIAAKLLNKEVVIVVAGSAVRDSLFSKDKFLGVTRILASLCFSFADNLIVYAPNLIQEWNLESYHQKILIAHRHFLDFDKFTVTIPLADRPPLIGFIGRLSGEKGVHNFVQALTTIFTNYQEVRVLIGGDGQLKDTIEIALRENRFASRVDLPGWISHDDLPKYLNQLRLLVLPSYSEGLPNIMLEAMACGTPVVATPVGAIRDIIVDNKTGFIMENNSPECIADNVIRALNSTDIKQIAENGRRFVEENFTFERVTENWRMILNNISLKRD